MELLARARKAIVAGVGAAGAAFTAGIADGSLSQQDWYLIVGAGIVVGAVTFLVPNKAVASS